MDAPIRRALEGRWGILEVADCEDVVSHLVARGLADPRRVAIRGGSAGGFTTLSALTRSRHILRRRQLLRDRRSHRARPRNPQVRIALPAHPGGGAAASRSAPPFATWTTLRCPVIFFQGGEDRVVPPGQARAMVEALDRQKLPVAYLEFPEESHGFLRAANIQRALAAEYAFYCRVFGIAAAEHPGIPGDPQPVSDR